MSDQAQFGVNTAHTESIQPKPEPTERSRSVTDAVIEDMRLRRETGVRKYGVELLTHNGRDPLLDVYQELLDAVVYTKQCLIEREDAKKATQE
jgi:hypothetical protein